LLPVCHVLLGTFATGLLQFHRFVPLDSFAPKTLLYLKHARVVTIAHREPAFQFCAHLAFIVLLCPISRWVAPMARIATLQVCLRQKRVLLADFALEVGTIQQFYPVQSGTFVL